VRRRFVGGLAATWCLIALTACGTSLKRTEIERAAGVNRPASASQALPAASGGTTGTAGASGAVGSADAATATGSAASAAAGAAGTSAGASASPATGATSSASAGTVGGSTGTAAAGPVVIIANVGTLTGVTGTAVKGVTEAVQAWSANVNANGGVGGHPVKLIVADDGGDANKHLQLVKQMVEQYKAIAFVGNPETTTQSQQAVDYLKSKGVPTVGDDSANAFGLTSPMIFPAITSADYYSLAISFGFAGLAHRDGLKKIALITCVEASVCQQAYDNFEKQMAKVDLTPVSKAQTSVTQPDFTPQCLQARNAGAELLSIGMDFNSVRRAVNSCHQQGYFPKIITPAVNPGMEKEALWQGTYVGWMTFSPFVDDGPAIHEFQAAMTHYQASAGINLEHAVGWTDAKLFEKAVSLANVGSGPVTSADVVQGLNAMHDETLGGLTGRLNFPKGKPATPIFCSMGVVIKNNQFTNPLGSSPRCQPLPKV
jgi:branched-chain amino acid transport system substrate-binding protein